MLSHELKVDNGKDVLNCVANKHVLLLFPHEAMRMDHFSKLPTLQNSREWTENHQSLERLRGNYTAYRKVCIKESLLSLCVVRTLGNGFLTEMQVYTSL